MAISNDELKIAILRRIAATIGWQIVSTKIEKDVIQVTLQALTAEAEEALGPRR